MNKTSIRTLRIIAASLALLLQCGITTAETVSVKYAGEVNLSDYDCQWITRSSFINRACFNRREASMILLLGRTYYKHCRVPGDQFAFLVNAPSMGRYYNGYIKGRYGCR